MTSKLLLLPTTLQCTTITLRLTSLFLTLLIPFLSYSIITSIQPSTSTTSSSTTISYNKKQTITETSWIIISFPVVWFFSAFYYTDVASLSIVLGSLVGALKGWHWLGGLVSFFLCDFFTTFHPRNGLRCY
jgi:hypothetical protein